jgi:HD-GYP domain-containing protein (c-di-GMP phosphodiesterase class II)
MGFKDISSWASSVQEKNDGSGYPYGLSSKDLSLKQRLLAVLIIYESLRKRYEHEKSIDMMMNMARKKHIDESIVKDFDEIFA